MQENQKEDEMNKWRNFIRKA